MHFLSFFHSTFSCHFLVNNFTYQIVNRLNINILVSLLDSRSRLPEGQVAQFEFFKMVKNQKIDESSKQPLQSKSILPLSAAAILLGLSISSLYKKTSKITIPFYCPGGRLIFHKGLEAWLLQNRKATREEIGAETISNLVTKNNERRLQNENI